MRMALGRGIRRVGERARRVANAAEFRVRGHQPVTIFMYHRVTPEATREWGPWRYAITPGTFERQVARFAERYDVRHLSDVVSSCVAGDSPDEPTAVITFDDGYRDNLTEALPVLERHDASATVFVSGRFLDGTAPYEYRLAAALESASSISLALDSAADGGAGTVDEPRADRRSRQRAYDRIHSVLKFERASVRDEIVRSVTDEAASTVHELESVTPMLTPEELREIDEHPLMEVGAHGDEHVPLTTLSTEEARADAARSKTKLEDVLDRSVTQFSYPYGAHSDAVVEAVADAGFTTAVTTKPRRIPASEVDRRRLRLPRLDGSR